MSELTNILGMLDWNNSLEIQRQGIDSAKKEKSIVPFIQPVTPEYNKNVWDNCALIIAERSDEELKPYLSRILQWLQDMNWPGSFCILNRLQKYTDKEYIQNEVNACIEMAIKDNDEVWKVNLEMLLNSCC